MWLHSVAGVEVGDGARHLQYAVVGTGVISHWMSMRSKKIRPTYFNYSDIVSDNLSAFIGNEMTLCGYEIRFMLYGASNPGQYSFISRSLKTLMSSMAFLQFQQSGVNAFSL